VVFHCTDLIDGTRIVPVEPIKEDFVMSEEEEGKKRILAVIRFFFAVT
jgi:hypothetical protein